MNLSARRFGLALVVAALSAIAIGACGDDSSKSSSDAQQVLQQTFKATSTSLRNARLDGSVQLEPEGLLAIAAPISLTLKGPLVVPAGAGHPRADLAAVVAAAGQRYAGGLVSDGKHAFLKLDGRAYRLDDKGLQKGLESLRPSLLDLEPLRWSKDERTKGNEPVAGTDTIHVTGTVDAAALLRDLDGIVPAKTAKQIAAAVKSATFELWTGADDKILRQLALRVAFEFAKGSKPPVPGLEAGKLQLRVRLVDVNGAAPEIKAPAGAVPLSKAPTDRGLGGLLACLSKSGASGAGLAQCVAALGP